MIVRFLCWKCGKEVFIENPTERELIRNELDNYIICPYCKEENWVLLDELKC